MNETEAFEYFHRFNESGKATLSVLSPAEDEKGKAWRYQVFVFFPKQDGSYSDATCFGNDLTLCILSCVDSANVELMEELTDAND